MTDEKPEKTPSLKAQTKKPADEWAKAKATPAWVLAGAKAGNKWDEFYLVTENEFDSAIGAVAGIKIS